jgi:protein SCO1
MTRIAAIVAACVALAALAVGLVAAFRQNVADPFAGCRTGTVAGTAAIGGPFTLTSGTGERLNSTEAITKPTLVYFGYTFCPDVCPTDLARNALAVDILTERGMEVGLVFITIDPERDAPEVVQDYVAAMHPAMLGLTGTPEEIAEVAKAYKVFYRKAGDDPENYLMDHSTFTYLMAPRTGFLEFFPSDLSAEALAERVGCFLEAS